MAITSTVIGGLTIGLTATAAPPLQSPVPPTLDHHGYKYGVQSKSRPGTVRNGRTGRTGTGHAVKPWSISVPQGPQPQLCGWWREGPGICKPISPFDEPTGKPKISPAALAATEWGRLPIPAPMVRTAPPRGTDGLVGLPHWFWVENWRPLTGRAEAGEGWIEVTARPQSLTIDPGGGRQAVRCPGPGTVYDPSQPASSQRTECSYTFTRSSAGLPGGAYRVRATVVWSGTWVGSDGSSGALPPLSRSVTFPVRVGEAQSLYR